MILPAPFAKLAAGGRATVALIPVREPRIVKRKGQRGTYMSKPWVPVTGSYETLRASINGKAAKIASVQIGEHTTMLLAGLADESPEMIALARATGYRTRHEFALAWMEHYDRREWPPLEEALCPRCEGFAVLQDEEECPDCDAGVIEVSASPAPEEVMARFKARHGLMPVHVVRFQIDRTEHVRLLSPASRPRGDELGYTENPSNALKDAGEAVPVAYQTLISREASARDDRLRRARVEEARVMIESGLRLLEAVGDEELRVPINAVRRRVDRLDRRLPDAA